MVPESGFEVTRRVLVDFEGISLRRKFVNGLEPENIHMMIGMYVIAGCLLLTSNKQHTLYIKIKCQFFFLVQGL